MKSPLFLIDTGMDPLSIPADVMPLVFEYMDPMSLACMAKTCRAWKKVVYRTSVWARFLWKPKWNYSSLFRRREGARHIGEPHALCFLAWATRQLIQSPTTPSRDELPLSFNSLQDPAQIVRRTYRLWCEKKKPCVHMTHHEWTNVCILSPELARIRKSEIEQLRHQLCDPCVESFPVQSPYAMWLQRQIDDYLGAVPPPATAVPANASTLLGRLLTLLTERSDALNRELVQLVRLVVSGFEKSILALHPSSARAFDEGDQIERKDKNRVWDGTVFTVFT